MAIELDAQDFSFRTVALSNLRFLEASTWGEIPLDKNGEDANSELFGLTYPAVEEGSDVVIPPPTLAREQLFINVEIENPTEQYWVIKRIDLEVLEEFELSHYQFREGAWITSSIKTLSYVPDFIINQASEDYPKNLVIGPSSGYSDNRFWIKVNHFNTGKADNTICRFQLKCTLVSKTDGSQRIIYSDKSYLLAAG